MQPFVPGLRWSVLQLASPEGTVSATVPAGGATDGFGNQNQASTSTDNTVTIEAPGCLVKAANLSLMCT